ncbi:glycosyltransferase family 2 protein [Parapedobacter sp. 10938]|uniref:glycosyltransferase family 2 protein n=1 Tax=Parapedobacter flavus TaxID=3110225 RepID=UPI002DBA7A9A|nr:glycosyltransferase family 2 protein [Parapedobacter sp. 10938]MEC3879880.1 glycosyltransferase family 2 protein [Parapedobacter sp. 10938]
MGLVSIITVNYHQAALTADFLHSIIRFAQGKALEVIVVDNGATVDNEDVFKAVFPDLIYIRSQENLGFAGGNNLGIQHATGDYLLFLNNDTEITAGFIEKLRDELERHPDIGLLSPLILYHEDKTKIQYAGYTPMNYLTGRNSGVGTMDEDNGQYDHLTTETGYCHGAAMICRRKDLERVGLMPEHFFLYYEELDWCEQFKRAGLKIGFTGKAKIYHKESMSVGKESPLKTYFMVRNRWLFIRRNAQWPSTVIFCCYYLTVAIPVLLVKYLLKGKPNLITAALRGVWWNFTHSKNSKDLGIKR